MKKLFLFLIVAFMLTQAHAQYVYKIKCDSLLVTNDSCTAEFNLENSTKNVKGFLFNKGNGRTEFRKAVLLNDSTLIMGGDTFLIRGRVPGLQKVINAGNELTQNNTIIVDRSKTLDFAGNGGNTAISISQPGPADPTHTRSYIYNGINTKYNLYGAGIVLGADSLGRYMAGMYMDPSWGATVDFAGCGFHIDPLETRQIQVYDASGTGLVYANDYSAMGTYVGTTGHEGERWIPDLGYVRKAINDSTNYERRYLARTPVNNTNYTVLFTDHMIAYTSLTAARTVTLPFAQNYIDSQNGNAFRYEQNRVIIVKDESGMAGTYNITVNVTSNGGTIEGASSKVINTNYGSLTFYSNGSNWFVK